MSCGEGMATSSAVIAEFVYDQVRPPVLDDRPQVGDQPLRQERAEPQRDSFRRQLLHRRQTMFFVGALEGSHHVQTAGDVLHAAGLQRDLERRPGHEGDFVPLLSRGDGQ